MDCLTRLGSTQVSVCSGRTFDDFANPTELSLIQSSQITPCQPIECFTETQAIPTLRIVRS